MFDYKSRLDRDEKPKRRVRAWLGLLAGAAISIGLGYSRSDLAAPDPLNAANLSSPATTIVRPTLLDLPESAHSPDGGSSLQRSETGTDWIELRVAQGDSLATLFQGAGIPARTLHNIMQLGEPAQRLKKLFPGDVINVRRDLTGDLIALTYEIDKTEVLQIDRDAEHQFHARLERRELETRLARAAGVVETSLFEAAVGIGLSERMTMALANIFGWDVDFALDIRAGDSFVLIYEQKFLEGELVSEGDIVAAEFNNQGRAFRALRFIDENGISNYFAPDGSSTRKAFLRSPVDFRRISSGFHPQRFHPVLGVKRPHRGVDYAAKIGTPVRATGDGKVIHRGRKGGYGKTLVLRHGGGYATLYAHLNGYAKSTAVGKWVKQGQIIGYVGKTGLATGPHLHYEFRINGVHRNPLTVRLPDAEPLPSELRAKFAEQTAGLVDQLDLLRRVNIALDNP